MTEFMACIMLLHLTEVAEACDLDVYVDHKTRAFTLWRGEEQIFSTRKLRELELFLSGYDEGIGH